MEKEKPASHENAQKACSTCALWIPIDAVFCTHCENYQNWRRHWQFSANTLPMLVALVAVTGALASPLMPVLFKPDSTLKMLGFSASEKTLIVTVANVGNRPGVVAEVMVMFGNDPRGPAYSEASGIPIYVSSNGNPIVPPGEVKIIEFKVDFANKINDFIKTVPLWHDNLCWIDLAFTEFSGKDSHQELYRPCISIFSEIHSEIGRAAFEYQSDADEEAYRSLDVPDTFRELITPRYPPNSQPD
jgi:hypothetical protein